jgi:hypothetical protein
MENGAGSSAFCSLFGSLGLNAAPIGLGVFAGHHFPLTDTVHDYATGGRTNPI